MELGRFEGYRKVNDFKVAYDSMVNAGLKDSSGAVRAAALRAKLEAVNLFGPEADRVLVEINAEKDEEARKQLQAEYNMILVEKWKGAYHNHANSAAVRDNALQRLLKFAAGSDERAALLALTSLETVYDEPLIRTLAALYPSAPSDERKIRILSAVGVNNDQALPLALSVYQLGLADPSAKVRSHALGILLNWGSSQSRKQQIAPVLKTAAAKETDPELKRKMEEALK